MSYSSSTANYNLPQWAATDKPTYLGDQNTAYGVIDTQMKANADAAIAAGSAAASAAAAVGTLSNLTTDAKTSAVAAINEVDNHADAAQVTANNAAASATDALTGVANLVETFALSVNTSYNRTQLTITGGSFGGNDTEKILFLSRSVNGKMFKLYGNFLVNPSTASSAITVSIANSGVAAPDEDYTIIGTGFAYMNGDQTIRLQPVSIKVKTNGTLEIGFTGLDANQLHVCRMISCLYFNTDFGDVNPAE